VEEAVTDGAELVVWWCYYSVGTVDAGEEGVRL